MGDHRIRVFKIGRNQVIRIPPELELPVREATMYRDGNRLIIEPIERASLRELVASWGSLDVDFRDLNDPLPDGVER